MQGACACPEIETRRWRAGGKTGAQRGNLNVTVSETVTARLEISIAVLTVPGMPVAFARRSGPADGRGRNFQKQSITVSTHWQSGRAQLEVLWQISRILVRDQSLQVNLHILPSCRNISIIDQVLLRNLTSTWC